MKIWRDHTLEVTRISPTPERGVFAHMKAFALNLFDRPERLMRLRARAAGVCDIERFEAIDTRSASKLCRYLSRIERVDVLRQSMITRSRATHADLTPGAVGCALSHGAMSAEGLRRGLEEIMVFEDDAALPPTLAELVEDATRCARGARWDMILLGWCGRPSSRQDEILRRVYNFWGLHAYVASRSGMSKIVAETARVRCQLDSALSDLALSGKMRIFGVNQQHMRIPQKAKGSDVAFGRMPSKSPPHLVIN